MRGVKGVRQLRRGFKSVRQLSNLRTTVRRREGRGIWCICTYKHKTSSDEFHGSANKRRYVSKSLTCIAWFTVSALNIDM